MGLEKRARRSVVLFLSFVIFIFVFGVNCTLEKIIMEEVRTEEAKTRDAKGTNWAQTSTEYHRNFNNQTATVLRVTENARLTQYAATDIAATQTSSFESTRYWQTELAPKPPRITGINFPAEIPGNKSTMIGLLYFKDDDGDISHVVYDVITATEFGGGSDTDPKLDHGTWKDGAIKIYLWCDGEQYVTLQATIHDQEGNTSNPMTFSFTCKVSD